MKITIKQHNPCKELSIETKYETKSYNDLSLLMEKLIEQFNKIKVNSNCDTSNNE